MDLRSPIQQIALEWPSYGYRRVHRELTAEPACGLPSIPAALVLTGINQLWIADITYIRSLARLV
jgi:hypothetical protein